MYNKRHCDVLLLSQHSRFFIKTLFRCLTLQAQTLCKLSVNEGP